MSEINFLNERLKFTPEEYEKIVEKITGK